MRTIAIVNQKGGSGKTTTAINLAAVYAERGLRTLLIDMDPQAHCAAGLGVPESRIERGIAEALLADHDSAGFDPRDMLWEVSRKLHLVPSTVRLAALEAPGGGLHERADRDRRLLSLLGTLGDRFDRCLIDCPPTIGLLTFNAMRAARETLIPVETGYFAMKGAERQWQTIRRLVERIDRAIAVHLLPTIHNDESRMACDVLNALRRKFAGQILPVVIHEHEELREAASFGQPICEFAPHSKARQDFEKLAEWLETHMPQAPHAQQPAEADTETSAGPAEDDAGQKPITIIPHTGTPSISASSAGAPASSRVAELVRRVQAIAQHNAERGAELGQSIRAELLEGAPAEVRRPTAEPARPTTPEPSAAEQPDTMPIIDPTSTARTPAVSDEAIGHDEHDVDSLETPSRPRDDSAGGPDHADTDCTVDASPNSAGPQRSAVAEPKLPRIGSELPTPLRLEPPPSGPTAAHQRQIEHLYGVRPTSTGVLFVQPAGDVRHIAVAGDFNNWSATANPMRRNREIGVFETLIPIAAGRHQYRLVIDGIWQADPYNPQQQHNEYGEPNSIVVVESKPFAPTTTVPHKPAVFTMSAHGEHVGASR